LHHLPLNTATKAPPQPGFTLEEVRRQEEALLRAERKKKRKLAQESEDSSDSDSSSSGSSSSGSSSGSSSDESDESEDESERLMTGATSKPKKVIGMIKIQVNSRGQAEFSYDYVDKK